MKIPPSNKNQFNKDTLTLEKLPTNTLSHLNRVQRWANFIAGYSIEFVDECLKNSNPKTDIVLDPFSGCGTTILAARNRHLKAFAFERHDLFHCLSKIKSQNFSIDELNIVKNTITSSRKSIEWSQDSIKFLSKMYTEPELRELAKFSMGISLLPERLTSLGVAFFLAVCEKTCGAQTDGIYKAPTTLKNKTPIPVAIESAYRFFLDDISSEWYQNIISKAPNATIYHHSSEDMSAIEDSTIKYFITSPPYLNNFDYCEMTRMQLYLLGWTSSWKDISTKIRNKLITNTTTALKGKKELTYQNAQRDSLPKKLNTELNFIVQQLDIERKNRAGKKEYNFLVFPYYAQIQNVLKEIHRTAQKGAEIHWVVADAALYGIHIETHIHTKIIMQELGFQNVKIHFMRKRGHRWILDKRDGSEKGLGEYHITAQRT